ncbi:hypothetical protein [Olivibacter jilunii]|uniref:hypothetical protein n=1 Tax=Olivibacter jilunii TaxID=985016 RepID=UPI003F1522CA
MKRTIELNLPEDFIVVSELFNISVEKTLETLSQCITLYEFLDKDNKVKQSEAIKILQRFLKFQSISREKMNDDFAHKFHPYLENISKLIKIDAGRKSREYQSIVNCCYDELNNIA